MRGASSEERPREGESLERKKLRAFRGDPACCSVHPGSGELECWLQVIAGEGGDALGCKMCMSTSVCRRRGATDMARGTYKIGQNKKTGAAYLYEKTLRSHTHSQQHADAIKELREQAQAPAVAQAAEVCASPGSPGSPFEPGSSSGSMGGSPGGSPGQCQSEGSSARRRDRQLDKKFQNHFVTVYSVGHAGRSRSVFTDMQQAGVRMAKVCVDGQAAEATGHQSNDNQTRTEVTGANKWKPTPVNATACTTNAKADANQTWSHARNSENQCRCNRQLAGWPPALSISLTQCLL